MARTWTVAEAAAVLCLDPSAVTRRIRTGRLAAEVVTVHGGLCWRITDLTIRPVGDRLPARHIRDGNPTIDMDRLNLHLALPEWRAADAWARGQGD